jgi:hypothetical protein
LPTAYAPAIATWAETDPLRDVFLATFGDFPSLEESGVDYRRILRSRLEAEELEISESETLVSGFWEKLWPLTISEFGLQFRGRHYRDSPGVFIGDVDKVVDLIEFWNLRASGVNLLFYDPSYEERVRPAIEAWIEEISEQAESDGLHGRSPASAWSRPDFDDADFLKELSHKVARCRVSGGTWNGLNVVPPQVIIDTVFSLAAVEREHGRLRATISLPNKPFEDGLGLGFQHLVTSVSAGRLFSEDAFFCFRPPFVPKLNEYYGRECLFHWNAVRSEPEALGILTRAGDTYVSIGALDHEDIIVRVFEACGVTAAPSDAGRVTRRLVNQMGGLQGCRVFKIRGIRELIREYSPDQAFTRSAAEMRIGNIDPQTNQPRFSQYESLHIERRDTPKLKPQDAFLYLIKKQVIRAGLNIKCPACELTFWHSINDLNEEPTCNYCGTRFNLALQLRNRDWSYRRSGLFGRADDQKGAIPVSLALQQLDANLSDDHLIISTGLDLQWNVNPQKRCEVDLVVVTTKGRLDSMRPAVILGECKAAGPIDDRDVTNLSDVADQLSRLDVDVYLLFAKTKAFSSNEIETCRKGQTKYRNRVIMLSDDELEPYFITDKIRDSLPNSLKYGMDTETLVRISAFKYFKGDKE